MKKGTQVLLSGVLCTIERETPEQIDIDSSGFYSVADCFNSADGPAEYFTWTGRRWRRNTTTKRIKAVK